MKVPIDGITPGLRYGHTMVYIMPILILFAGSGKSEILNDIWILSTDKTPFKWEKLGRIYNPLDFENRSPWMSSSKINLKRVSNDSGVVACLASVLYLRYFLYNRSFKPLRFFVS